MSLPERVPSSQGVEVAVHDLGGTGPFLIFCHATGFHGRVWIPTAQHLQEHYHCVSLDFRGHGATGLPDGADLLWSSIAGDLLSVIRVVSPNEAVFAAGHSLGGGAIALVEGGNPGTIAKAWAFEPILFGTDPSIKPSPLAEGARRRRATFDSYEAATARYSSRPPLDSLHPEALEAYVKYGFGPDADGGVTLLCAPQTEATVFDNHAAGSKEAALAMKVPFALVAGNESDGPAELAREVSQLADHLTLFEMDLNHFGPMQDPKAVAEALIAWFN